MIAVIYARKSTAQHDAEDETRSVTRQVENARVFARAKGWTVLNDHIYIDDGISGASSLALLPAKSRMWNAIKAGPPFTVLICQGADRFSRRDGDEAFTELKTVAKAGVQVWFYSDGSRFKFGDFANNTLGFLKSEFAAEYRRAISRTTHEAFVRKAQFGHVTGGRTFGYDNVRLDKHTERRVNDAEAAVVRGIFDLCASGAGYTRITKVLNAEGAISPKPFEGRPTLGWSTSSVREVLHRELYRGVLVWNRTKKRDESGDKKTSVRPPEEWLRFDRPDLRIVTNDQWDAAHARLHRVRRTMQTAIRNRVVRSRDVDSQYLLTGFARCTACGGTISVVSRSHGRQRAYFYGCLTNWKRGGTVCPNDLVLPIDRVNDAVLKALVGDVLRPAVVRAIIDEFLERLLPANVGTRAEELQRELRVVDSKIRNLTTAIEQGGADIAAIIEQLRTRQQERETLLADLSSAETLQRVQVDRPAIESQVLGAVAEWRELLSGSVADGRQMLGDVLEAPLQFTPAGKTYRFTAPVATGKLIAGAVLPTRVASPTGFEPVFWP